MKQSGSMLFVKRVLDVSVASTMLCVSAPVLCVAAFAVGLTMGTPIIFEQTRPGRNGQLFQLYKLRTMKELRDDHGQLLSDAERLTQIGRLLRAFSLDELPQLWNVIRGDMSLVGPRPLLVQYLHRYSIEQARRHNVLPGITGWAQVNGRNAINWDAKFQLDTWYVDHWSVALDLKIMFITMVKVVRREGISNAMHETMSEFIG